MIDAAAATTTSNDRFDMRRRQIQCDSYGLMRVTPVIERNPKAQIK